jgi:hypothetical protein
MTNKAQDKIETDTETLREIVREEVQRALQNLTGDPDAGLKIKDEVIEEIKKSEAQIEERKVVPFEKVKEKIE